MRILFAEDELSLSKAVAAVLEKNNYSVDAVYNGEDALDYLDTENYDGVILDIMMPKVDGLSVLKEMRSKGDRTPVLLLTAKSEIDDKVLGLDTGANDYLTKPFDMKELLARLRAMLRISSESQTDSKLHFGNVTLDCVTYDLTGPGGSFKLANKEFQMLEMMMKNPKNLVSVDRFMERIWGLDSDTDQNVVWVYLSYLRKKLESIHADIQIKAQRNAGYYLEEKNS